MLEKVYSSDAGDRASHGTDLLSLQKPTVPGKEKKKARCPEKRAKVFHQNELPAPPQQKAIQYHLGSHSYSFPAVAKGDVGLSGIRLVRAEHCDS